MRVFVTGATGYVGRKLTETLIETGHSPACLVRPGSERKLGRLADKVDIISGGIGDAENWHHQLRNIDAVINLIGIIREFPNHGVTFEKLHVETTVKLVDICAEQGIKRYLQMSALGASPESKSEYHQTKFRAENYIKNSDLDWTIFRPSLIFGKGNLALAEFVKLIKSAPVVPVVGDGKYRLQPVALENVCEGFVKALDKPETIGKTYEIAGSERVTYDQLLDRIGQTLNRKVPKIHMPVGLTKLAISPFEYFKSFPLTKSQIEMLLEENISDSNLFYDELNIEPEPLDSILMRSLEDEIEK